MSDTRCRIAPEPLEAPEPQPVRQRDLVRARALLHGYNTLQSGERAVISFDSFAAGYEAVEDYRACHDKRGRP